MPLSKHRVQGLVLLAVLLSGIILVSPYAHYQDYLAQGDHGRDLYAAEAVYRGELPYRDFWWVYGPLTPYYYGLFFKALGVKVSSMIAGKLVLRLLGGVLMALAMMRIASPLAAFLCACWFMFFQQDFFFTYNHIAGIVMILGVVWCLLSYIRENLPQAAWGALGFVFLLCLIKVNFGVAALAMAVATVGLCDVLKKTRANSAFYLTALVGLPLAVFGIYWSLLHGLSAMEIRQCLPYKEGDQPYSTSAWTAISSFFKITFHTVTSGWMNTTLAVLINASALRCVYLVVKNKMPAESKKTFLLTLGMLGLFYALNMHEFIKSGVWYRGFWAQPVNMMIIFVLMDTAAQSIPQAGRKLVFFLLASALCYSWFSALRITNTLKKESQYLAMPRGDVYLGNAPAWMAAVKQTTEFLNKTLKPGELFFALPYDCLYYYLTGKKTPTRQLIFFEHIKIPSEQEKSVLAQLEKNHVNYVLVSNRAFARQEYGLGFLGSTYCPLIGKYIQDNFVPVARFGDWTNEPGWAWNHGTLVLKRKGT